MSIDLVYLWNSLFYYQTNVAGYIQDMYEMLSNEDECFPNKCIIYNQHKSFYALFR